MSTPGAVSPLFLASSSSSPAGLQVSRSLIYRAPDGSFCSRTFTTPTASNRWTWAGWIKRVNTPAVADVLFSANFSSGLDARLSFASDNTFLYTDGGGSGGSLQTTAVYRDFSSWMHVVFVYDSPNATSTDRLQLYINGIRITTANGLGSATYPTQNTASNINGAKLHSIGQFATVIGNYANMYLADVHFIDGQALDPSSFAETNATTGQWVPKAYSGSGYGTNGFQLKFADNSSNTATTLGKDTSGNSNNWTPNNLSVTAGAGNDSLVDTPTSYGTDTGVGGEVRGNYCTFNPLFALASLTLTNGNLETSSPGAAWKNAKGTLAMTTGKWYWEHTVPTTGASDGYIGGVATATADYSSSSTGIWGRQGTAKYSNGSDSTSFGSTTSGDILGFAFDADTGKLWVAQNGTWVGDPAAGTSESWSSIPSGVFPYVAAYNQANVINFGQRAFAYTNGRSGFKALVDTNLPTPVVAKPNTVMDVVTYTGNGSTQTISGLAFEPDLFWHKSRGEAYSHVLVDSVRGVSNFLQSNTANAETTTGSMVTYLNSNGFTINNNTGDNTNNVAHVAWTWDAGTSTVTNTQGSITSSVRANASAGFSIVSWTGNNTNGATVGHGLNAIPKLTIYKNRSISANWIVNMSPVTGTGYLVLNSTGALDTNSQYVSPTSTTLVLPSYSDTNANSMIAYCFAPVVGYSNGFSYTGNGSADGSFVYLGFRPRLIMLKRSDSTSNWTLLDTSREGYNVDNDPLYPNLSDAEGTTDLLDITSNGFKLRSTDASVNASAGTYIGFAWAEAPFAYSRAR